MSCVSAGCFEVKYYNGISWSGVVKRVMNSGLMGRILGINKSGIPNGSKSDIWLLGVSYDPSVERSCSAFIDDFSSRILVSYRKGFSPIGDTKYSSDVNWGCMLRSSQMLVAQALLVHRLGRGWRKSPLDQKYVEILRLFGDSQESAYSIHNLLQAGNTHGLSPGSWVGPYAMCRTWETLVRSKRQEDMAIYVVSGDENGERGGAPVLCIDDIVSLVDVTPVLFLVPLVLGLEKINARYIPLLAATFGFPQSVGILGGRPGLSTYIVGVQDDKAFYLDPHQVQPAVDVKTEIDTSSYHCNTVRHFPLDSIDPSLAIGFYCRDKSDFDDFCMRVSELVDQSNGAPLFTITETRRYIDNTGVDSFDAVGPGESDGGRHEDEWQLL